MTYKDLIEELKEYTPEELNQHVVFQFVANTTTECDYTVSAEYVDWITAYNQDNKIVILV